MWLTGEVGFQRILCDFQFNTGLLRRARHLISNYLYLGFDLAFVVCMQFCASLRITGKCVNILMSLKELIKSINRQVFADFQAYKRAIEVVGYIRRVWYLPVHHILIFRLGKSFLNTIYLRNSLIIELVKKRVLYLFGPRANVVHQAAQRFVDLCPTSAYKLSGLVFKDKSFVLKKSKKQGAGGR
jgi:hypothetical protein